MRDNINAPGRKDCNQKRDYGNKKRAKIAAQRALANYGHRMYTYRCTNGHVHLTSQDPAGSPHQQRRDKRYEDMIIRSRDGVGFFEDPTGVIYKKKEEESEDV